MRDAQPNELMSPDEVKRLAGGKARIGDQVKALEALGIPHKVVGKRVVVSRYHVQDWLAGADVSAEPPPELPPAAQELRINTGLAEYQQRARQVAQERGAVEAASLEAEKAAAPHRRRAAQAARGALRRAAERQQCPPWADETAIRTLYLEAAQFTRSTGVPHHVDQRLPLRGRLVSGLHVHNNLQILPAVENSRKGNRFEPC